MTWTEVDSAVTSPAETGIAFSAMKAQVILNCNNLPTQHPHYSSIGAYINEAKDEILTLAFSPTGRRILDLMPRLHNWRWCDVTIDQQNYLPLPASLMTLESVTCTRLTTAYAPSTTTEYPMFEEPDPVLFGLFNKTATGWPVHYRRNGSRVELYPTPDASPTNYLTQIVLRGMRNEDDLSDASDKLKMSLRMQKFVVELATAIAMEKMGWEEASSRRISVETRLDKIINLTARERRAVTHTEIAGTPR